MTQRLFPISLALFLAAAAGAALPASGADVRGHVDLVDEKGQRAAGARQTVVYYTPDAGARPEKPPAEPFEIVTVRKDFQPHVLVVPVGSTVSFPNEDPILHNVFSVSGENRFDLGLYRQGESKSATFEQPGVVRVFCNVHHAMATYVVVLATPHWTQPDANGDFVLRDVPAGKGRLTVWHERRDDPVLLDVQVPSAEPLEVRLELNRERVPQHKNKFGKRYSRSRRGKDYN